MGRDPLDPKLYEDSIVCVFCDINKISFCFSISGQDFVSTPFSKMLQSEAQSIAV